MSNTKVFVVDDFEPFRRFVRPLLEAEADLQIVGEASDGLEAVQMVTELQPNLILLDIGLPGLNGIDVARRVLQLTPRPKILFVSQESSFDVVQEALGLGAMGYVHKQRAASELLAAIKAVQSGKRFISSSLVEFEYDEPTKIQNHHHHEALFYSCEAILLDSLFDFIAAAQTVGDATIVLATKPHLDELLERLRAQGLPVNAAIESGRLIPLEVVEELSRFMVGDMPDSGRFFSGATALLERAAAASLGGTRRVAACGECAPFLLRQGMAAAAIFVEQYWNQLARDFNLYILCGYASELFESPEGNHLFDSICAEHSTIYSK